ncbi:MAG: penicillin-binding protein activator LpoB [Pirellulaceae bacterium]
MSYPCHANPLKPTVFATVLLYYLVISALLIFAGCRGHQYAHLLNDNQQDLVGSHDAGAETYNILVEESVAKLLGRQEIEAIDEYGNAVGKRICFVGVENKSSEDLGDFREQLYEQIDSAVASGGSFQTISSRYVDNGLRQLRLLPDDLMTPSHRRSFCSVMEQAGQPFDYLLFAKLTSGTTENNRSYQRDYLLTLELVDLETGMSDKESSKVRKGYHSTRMGKWSKYNPLTR